MPDVLDQSEVDALLAAVEDGQLPEVETHEKPVITTEEVSAYDFKRPERVGKDQLRALSGMHEGFARNLAAVLSGFMRTIVEVRVASVEQLTYSEFIQSLPNPTYFALLGAEPLEGHLMLEINPSITFPVMDRLLGGGKEDINIPERPLTEIELRILSKIVDLALLQLQEMWSVVQELKLTVQQTESNPQLVQIVAPNESVILVGIEISLGDISGMMNICIPFMVIEPVIGRLSLQARFSGHGRAASKVDPARLMQKLAPAHVELIAYLAWMSIRVSDLLSLEPGDILQTDRPAGSELLLTIEGKTKFKGYPGNHRGKKALRLKRNTRPNEHF